MPQGDIIFLTGLILPVVGIALVLFWASRYAPGKNHE